MLRLKVIGKKKKKMVRVPLTPMALKKKSPLSSL